MEKQQCKEILDLILERARWDDLSDQIDSSHPIMGNRNNIPDVSPRLCNRCSTAENLPAVYLLSHTRVFISSCFCSSCKRVRSDHCDYPITPSRLTPNGRSGAAQRKDLLPTIHYIWKWRLVTPACKTLPAQLRGGS